MSRVIYARHNEHDFLALRVRDNSLKDVKGELDLLRRSAGPTAPLCTQRLNCCRIKKKHILHINTAQCAFKNLEYLFIYITFVKNPQSVLDDFV